MTVVGTISVEASITDEMIDDYLVTAFEGGINYWCHNQVKVGNDDFKGCDYASEVVSKGGEVYILPDEHPFADGEPDWYMLNLPKMLNGIKLACAHFGKTPDALYDDHDAVVADVIVQYAIFGVLVFG